jgi:type II restriction enzyme
MTRIDEAKEILSSLGFDSGRLNDRSARTLMALGGINETSNWNSASNHRLGVRAILDWIREQLKFPVAENTRETYRRQTLHQFVEAGLVVQNDDDPSRSINSSKNVYRLTDEAIDLIRAFGTRKYRPKLKNYLTNKPGLQKKYSEPRSLARLPVSLPNGSKVDLSAGGQNVLIQKIVDVFCSTFIPGGQVLYIGDTDKKQVVYDVEKLASLGLHLDIHGKLPDLIVYDQPKNWLFLIEAASSHGPVDAKRKSELQTLFQPSSAGLVFVSCFPDRETMRKYLSVLAWETESWCASDPTHMIHLNGDRFLGPYTS